MFVKPYIDGKSTYQVRIYYNVSFIIFTQKHGVKLKKVPMQNGIVFSAQEQS